MQTLIIKVTTSYLHCPNTNLFRSSLSKYVFKLAISQPLATVHTVGPHYRLCTPATVHTVGPHYRLCTLATVHTVRPHYRLCTLVYSAHSGTTL